MEDAHIRIIALERKVGRLNARLRSVEDSFAAVTASNEQIQKDYSDSREVATDLFEAVKNLNIRVLAQVEKEESDDP